MHEDNAENQIGASVAATGLDYRRAVVEFHQPVYRFAFGLTASESDASDLIKETYETLMVEGGQIRDFQKLKSWLFTTLYRKFLARRCQTRCPKEDAETVRLHPAVESGAARRIDAAAVIRALQTLDEEHLALLALFYLEEFSNGQIASILDIPIDTFLPRIVHGKKLLRKRLEAAEPINNPQKSRKYESDRKTA